MATKLYSNGYPFRDPLPHNLNLQVERVKKKKASCILIDGAVGMGKTTLAVELVDYLNSIYGKPETELKIKEHPQISLGGADFSKHFRECYKLKLPAVIYDEAGDFNKRGAITAFNQVINRLFEVYRGFRMIVIICLPNFAILDSKIFENQIPRMLIHIKDRSLVSGEYAAYSLSGMNWIRHWYDKFPKGAKNRAYSRVQPNFMGNFKNLNRDRELLLDKLSTYGKKEFFKESQKKLEGLLSVADLAHKVGKGSAWVLEHLKVHGVKPSGKLGRAYLYKKDIIEILLKDVKYNKST